jgi:hypothetical protein
MGIFRRLIPTAAQEPFIIEVTVSASDTFTLPLVSYGPNAPNFTVDWGDGSDIDTITSVTDSKRIHTYSSGGTYEIVMQGFIPGWNVNNNSAIRSMITDIIDFGRTGMGRMSFFGCNNLTSIPLSDTMIANGGTDEDGDGFRDGNGIGYAGLSSVRDFSGFMRATGLTSIPSGLFEFTGLATNFSDLFSFTALRNETGPPAVQAVPDGLFDDCTSATSFASAFNGCVQLQSVPSDLFNQNTNVLTFSGTFRNCVSLTNVLQFTNNSIVTVFDRVYDMYTTSNSLTGTAPEIWNRSPQPSGTDAFRNCTGLTNFASIPTAFK